MPKSVVQEVGEEMGLSPEQIEVVTRALEEQVQWRHADPSDSPVPTTNLDIVGAKSDSLLFLAFTECERRALPHDK